MTLTLLRCETSYVYEQRRSLAQYIETNKTRYGHIGCESRIRIMKAQCKSTRIRRCKAAVRYEVRGQASGPMRTSFWVAEAYCASDAVLLTCVPAFIVEKCRARCILAGARERQPVIFAVIYVGPAAWIIIRGAGTAKFLPFYRLHPCIAVTKYTDQRLIRQIVLRLIRSRH